MSRAERALRLDELPVFATDQELAEAIVGKHAAQKWQRDRLPSLANKPGFPAVDEFHGGRPVKLVIRFYDDYLGTADKNHVAPRGVEDPMAWNATRRSRRQG